ncbi:hypothetical protein [Candidatus Binatus sp.]|uniref:hypothetical protein n=1 Tax=Candidatus Binatus sp. TaxID=2811406 RepID=UPI003CA781D1
MKIELWRCEYPEPCSARGCKARAETLVKHIDEQGRLISQAELCDEHIKKTIIGWGNLKVDDAVQRDRVKAC